MSLQILFYQVLGILSIRLLTMTVMRSSEEHYSVLQMPERVCLDHYLGSEMMS
jgi:hypothetical protein